VKGYIIEGKLNMRREMAYFVKKFLEIYAVLIQEF